MFTTKQNFHHSILPNIGEIGYLVYRQTRYGADYLTGKKRKCRVLAFPLCDNCLPYSIGIHTAYFQFLDNGEIKQASGYYFEAML